MFAAVYALILPALAATSPAPTEASPLPSGSASRIPGLHLAVAEDLAADGLVDGDAPMPDAPASEDTHIGHTRSYLMEVNARGRYMFLPNSLLDIWYFRHDGAGETVPQRPDVAAYSMGLEFVVKDRQANGIFYLEYVNSLLKPGYWDDVESPPDDQDGSYIKPEFFGLVVVGADYGYEIHAKPWLSFIFGAGLGVGFTTGQLTEWQSGEIPGDGNNDNTDPSCGPAPTPAYTRSETCPDDGALRVPPVLPMVDVNLGFRFNFSDRASLRIEGGLHDLPYGGGALGITF